MLLRRYSGDYTTSAQVRKRLLAHRWRNAAELLKDLGNLRHRLPRAMRETAFMKATGLDGPSICRLESGKRENPTIRTLSRYAEALGFRLVLSLEPLEEAPKPE
jgi:transcriptional regulator with XRE-family HTH domain